MKEKKYDRDKVIEYAKKWAYSRNPQYYNYDGIGGDCTNFASQIFSPAVIHKHPESMHATAPYQKLLHLDRKLLPYRSVLQVKKSDFSSDLFCNI